MKTIIQIIIIVIGVCALAYGISKMASETATMIIPAWLIVAIVCLVVCAVSVGMGFLIKYLLSSSWHSLTFSSIVIIIVVGIYSVVAYKPTLTVEISPNYAGEVKLFVVKDDTERRNITVNNFGVGYITKKDFEEGFYPKILKGKSNISKAVREYSKGASLNALSDKYSFKYLSFVVPGRSDSSDRNIDDLLRAGAVDTMRLPRKTTP